MFGLTSSIFAILWTATFAAAPAPPDPAQVAARLKTLGLTLSQSECKPTSFSEGQGESLNFVEAQFDCGEFVVAIDASGPVQATAVRAQVESEFAKVQEVYGASKNPYAGYISQTAQCPQNQNLWHAKIGIHPFLIGRVTERGVWGACGKSESDFWSGLSFVESGTALAKVRITGKKSLPRRQFDRAARNWIAALKVQKK